MSSTPGSNSWFSGSSAADPACAASGNTGPHEYLTRPITAETTFAVGKTGRYLVAADLVDSFVGGAITANPPSAASTTFGARQCNLIATTGSTGIIVFDLTAITAASLASTNAAAFRTSVVNGTSTLTTVLTNAAPVPAVRLTVTNKGSYPAYVLASDKVSATAAHITIEGVNRSVGVRPRESLTLLFDPAVQRWNIVARSPQI